MNEDIEPASFRDPSGHIFISKGRVFRKLTPSGQQSWQDVNKSGVLPPLLDREWIIPTKETHKNGNGKTGEVLLEHEKIPFLSYAYEWPFSLLKKAALLHLDLLLELIPKGFILKDATPFNVQFQGVHPVLIDILSIERHKEGDPWAGYGQFCDTMLNPLFLTAYKGIPFQPWLRGQYQGIPAEDISPIFGFKDIFRSGVFSHIKLRALLHRKWNKPEDLKREDMQTAKFPASAILRNVSHIRSLLEKLQSKNQRISGWSTYDKTNTYQENEAKMKRDFIDRTLKKWRPPLTWDVGCNTGDYSFVAAQHSGLVIAMDRDADVIDLLVNRCQEKQIDNILPLVMDWSSPSPGLGWGYKEGKSFFERGKPDAVLALALIHHLSIKCNIPLHLQMEKFAQTSNHLIIEYVDREDAMFKSLLTNVGIKHEEYNETEFRRLINQYYTVDEMISLTPTRKLFSLSLK